ncbi:MAG: hypothetical protein EZS28_042408 [Streblomastix strix]|uniref:Uncharacterized protein n=1 Tax=Streblomastix strix TaxID=222440 RepID=A0A5J4TXD6_9EUKA|nr:MAG: hypothetical protein EZS28_042408 [Streblomastix strix]
MQNLKMINDLPTFHYAIPGIFRNNWNKIEPEFAPGELKEPDLNAVFSLPNTLAIKLYLALERLTVRPNEEPLVLRREDLMEILDVKETNYQNAIRVLVQAGYLEVLKCPPESKHGMWVQVYHILRYKNKVVTRYTKYDLTNFHLKIVRPIPIFTMNLSPRLKRRMTSGKGVIFVKSSPTENETICPLLPLEGIVVPNNLNFITSKDNFISDTEQAKCSNNKALSDCPDHSLSSEIEVPAIQKNELKLEELSSSILMGGTRLLLKELLDDTCKTARKTAVDEKPQHEKLNNTTDELFSLKENPLVNLLLDGGYLDYGRDRHDFSNYAKYLEILQNDFPQINYFHMKQIVNRFLNWYNRNAKEKEICSRVAYFYVAMHHNLENLVIRYASKEEKYYLDKFLAEHPEFNRMENAITREVILAKYMENGANMISIRTHQVDKDENWVGCHVTKEKIDAKRLKSDVLYRESFDPLTERTQTWRKEQQQKSDGGHPESFQCANLRYRT